MTELARDEFLDVNLLLEQSLPRAPGRWLGYGALAFLALLLLGAFGAGSSSAPPLLQSIYILGMIALMGSFGVMSWINARAAQQEQRQMQSAEELIQLRRWDQAALLLRQILSQPARSMQSHVQMLLYLAAVLARYHRYADTATVYDHLLEMDYQDEQSVHALRAGRAMSLLHDERLYDADRAINELRRDSSAANSAPLALIEIYRDVKTGHPQDAIDLFRQKLPLIRKQLGHRAADAYALAARAYDLLGQQAEAQSAYESATLLAPEAELHRRYSEVAALAGKYPAAQAPAEVA